MITDEMVDAAERFRPRPEGELIAKLDAVYRWFLRECREPNPMTGEVVERDARDAFDTLCDAIILAEGYSRPNGWPGEEEIARVIDRHMPRLVEYGLCILAARAVLALFPARPVVPEELLKRGHLLLKAQEAAPDQPAILPACLKWVEEVLLSASASEEDRP